MAGLRGGEAGYLEKNSFEREEDSKEASSIALTIFRIFDYYFFNIG